MSWNALANIWASASCAGWTGPTAASRTCPAPKLSGQIIALIREIRPDVILTHPENGLYPHPDHLAVWEIVRDAFTAAADPDEHPEAGAAWAAARLFTRALPQSFFERAPGLTEFRVQLNGQQLPFLGTPDDQIDVVDAAWRRGWRGAWLRGIATARSTTPKASTSTMPDDMRQEMAANEQYVLAAARLPLPEGVNDDLLAGLDSFSSPEEIEPAPEQASAELVAFLRDELAGAPRPGRTLPGVSEQAVCGQEYRVVQKAGGRRTAGPSIACARALRQVGEPAGAIEPAPRLLAAGKRQAKFEDQRRFLENTVAGTASRLQDAAPMLLAHKQQELLARAGSVDRRTIRRNPEDCGTVTQDAIQRIARNPLDYGTYGNPTDPPGYRHRHRRR